MTYGDSIVADGVFRSGNGRWCRQPSGPSTDVRWRERTRRLAAARSVRGHEAQERELRPRAEAHGRTPRARAGTDVDPQAAAAREPRRVGPVDQMNYERPREELAGVRVSRQLQVEAGLLGQRRDLRIVRQKQTEGRPRVAVGREVRTRPRVGIG